MRSRQTSGKKLPGRRLFDRQDGRVAPEPLQIIVVTHAWQEYVNHQRDVVEEDPVCARLSLDTRWSEARLSHPFDDVLRYGTRVRIRIATGDQKPVGRIGHTAEIQEHRLARVPLEGCLRRSHYLSGSSCFFLLVLLSSLGHVLLAADGLKRETRSVFLDTVGSLNRVGSDSLFNLVCDSPRSGPGVNGQGCGRGPAEYLHGVEVRFQPTYEFHLDLRDREVRDAESISLRAGKTFLQQLHDLLE